MPTYTFKCEDCVSEFDETQSFADYDNKKKGVCPECNSNKNVTRLLTTPLHCSVTEIRTIGQLAESNYKKNSSKIAEDEFKQNEKNLANIRAKLPSGASVSDNLYGKKEKGLDLSKLVSSDDLAKIKLDGDKANISETSKKAIERYVENG